MQPVHIATLKCLSSFGFKVGFRIVHESLLRSSVNVQIAKVRIIYWIRISHDENHCHPEHARKISDAEKPNSRAGWLVRCSSALYLILRKIAWLSASPVLISKQLN